MMDDQVTFLIFIGLCFSVGTLLSLCGPKPQITNRKVREDEMSHFLKKKNGAPQENDGKGGDDVCQ